MLQSHDILTFQNFYLDVEPLDRDTLHLCGNLLSKSGAAGGGGGEAEALLRRALSVNGSHVQCLCDYGDLLESAGRNLEAEDKYLRALQARPDSEGAMLRCANSQKFSIY